MYKYVGLDIMKTIRLVLIRFTSLSMYGYWVFIFTEKLVVGDVTYKSSSITFFKYRIEDVITLNFLSGYKNSISNIGYLLNTLFKTSWTGCIKVLPFLSLP